MPRMITTRRMPAQNPMLYYIRFVMPSEDLANRLPRFPGAALRILRSSRPRKKERRTG